MPSSAPVPNPLVQSSSSQLAVDLPQRPASTVVQPTQVPVQPAAPRPASVWDDLASLSGPSSNASLPLQYIANPTPTQPTVQPSTTFDSTNPYANFAVASGVQPQISPFSQPLSPPLQQNSAVNVQTPGFTGSLQPSLGATPGFLSASQSQTTNLLTPQVQQFNTGGTLGAGLNNLNGLQQPFSGPIYPSQTFLHQQTQGFPAQQPQQLGSGMVSPSFPGQAQSFQQLAPNATGNPFYAMQQQQQQQQQLRQAQPTGYIPYQQQPFGVSTPSTNPFSQMVQPGNPFSTVQTQGWQSGGSPAQQQQWGY